MLTFQITDLAKIQQDVVEFEKKGLIDPLKNVAQQRIYLFSGTKDYIVFPDVMKKLKQQYIEKFGVAENRIVADFAVPANHAMITSNYGSKCDALAVSTL